ncbi:MAG: D-alanyl-D-alanine carboxypeptidase/D-alanyl-D-alanine-endopeptidase [Muribaculaceae bacterium]|nr:D-alanyl-D-alanine carboxypeptidase/D-alanyl-D-alanine-endopeptidase [Muribaculaceae bacterium]
MRKIIAMVIMWIAFSASANAESVTKTITSLGINKDSVSVSVRDIHSGNTVYSLNDKTPRVPASTLKLVTSAAALDILGEDYKYETVLYKSTNNDLYLKLSGDPTFGGGDLNQLISAAKEKEIEPKTFYLDDTAFDTVEWGEGWQWDDEMNPLMPKFSIYNIDKNLLKIEVSPTANKMPAVISVKPFYPITFINLITTDTTAPTSIKFDKNTEVAANLLNASGTVAKQHLVMMPVPNPKMNFRLRLEAAIRAKKLEYFSPINYSKLPESNVYVVDSVEHEIGGILRAILKSSNNLYAETLFKTAGAIYSNSIGSRENSLKMLADYFAKIGVNAEDIKVVDGSGVSKNNIVTAEFMTDFLVKKSADENFEAFKVMLPTPGEGTLKNRMLYFKDNLYAKTGTLSDSSSIAGYITSRRGKVYAFDIMINDAKTSSSDKKNIEEQILRNIYTNY